MMEHCNKIKTMKGLLFTILGTLTLQFTQAQAPINTPDNFGAGNCLEFNGNGDLVEITDNSGISSLCEGTVSLWVRLNSNDLGLATVRLFSYAEAGVAFPNSDQVILDYRGGGFIQFSVSNNSTIITSPFTPPNTIINDDWYFISVVADNIGNIEIYVNGISQTLTNTTTDFFFCDAQNIDNLKLGAIQRDLVFSEGRKMIDEVRIWNRALTENEIKVNMCRSLQGNELGLVGYWNMNEGTGGTIPDLTSNGNDGTLQ